MPMCVPASAEKFARADNYAGGIISVSADIISYNLII